MNGIKSYVSFLGTTSVPVMNMLNNIVFPMVMVSVTIFLFFCIFRCVFNLNSSNDDTHKKGKKQMILILVSIIVIVLGPLIFWGVLSQSQAVVQPSGSKKALAPQGLNSMLIKNIGLNTNQIKLPASMLYV